MMQQLLSEPVFSLEQNQINKTEYFIFHQFKIAEIISCQIFNFLLTNTSILNLYLSFIYYKLTNISGPMSMKYSRPKQKTKTFVNGSKTPEKSARGSQKFGHASNVSEGRPERNSSMYDVRFKRKDLRQFEPGLYVQGDLTIDDVIDLKEVFDAYDSTGMGVLLPNDLKLLLTQNGFNPNKKTVYQIVAQFDAEQAGGLSFIQFMKAMDTKPFLNETKKQIGAIFKKYDRNNKGFLTLDDLKQINNHVKENVDEETLALMLQKADSNNDAKISFEDFYSVMVKTNY